MKMAASVAVPSEKIKLNTRKRGWSDFPGLKVEKSRHVFWRQIWVDCERPRSGWVFKIMKSSKHQYQKKVKSWKRSRVKELSREIKNNPRQLWQEVSKLKLVRSSSSPPDSTEINRWFEYFSSMFAADPPLLESNFRDILMQHFDRLNQYSNWLTITPSCVESFVRPLPLGKSPGADGIQPEHLRYGTPKLFSHIALLFQAIVSQQSVPQGLCQGVVTCIHKKGKDPKDCSSYRPITICSVLAKLLEKILCPIVAARADVGDNQFGFRSGLGVQNAHATFISIVEKFKKRKTPLFVCAIDISKAFDSVLHSQAVLSLLRAGVDPFVCNCLWQWYRKSQVRIRSAGQLSGPIDIRRGVKQGSVISPVIFNNAIRSATKSIEDFLIDDGIDASHLSYADDLLLISDNLESLQKAINAVSSALGDIGLTIEPSKTEFVVLNDETLPNRAVDVCGKTVLQKDKFEYLGLRYGNSIKATKNLVIAALKEKLRKTYGMLARTKGQFDKITLGRLCNAMFAPHVFFLTPLWNCFSKTERNQIRSIFFRYCKYLLGIPIWFRNSYVSQRYYIFEISKKMDELYTRFKSRNRTIHDFPLASLVH